MHIPLSPYVSLYRAVTAVLLALALTCCGSGGGDELPPTLIHGTLVDEQGLPVADAGLFIYETNESSITDEQGVFSVQSYKNLGSASVYLRLQDFTNRVELGQFPEGANFVHARILIDRSRNTITLTAISFDSELPAPTPTVAPTVPGQSTPGPRPTATPKPPAFDSAGNTSSFGIPAGLTGNVNAGRPIWASQCASCHVPEKLNRSYGQTKASIRVVPTMQNLQLSNQEIADVTAYLNRNRR